MFGSPLLSRESGMEAALRSRSHRVYAASRIVGSIYEIRWNQAPERRLIQELAGQPACRRAVRSLKMHSQNSRPDREQRRETAAPAASISVAVSQRIRRLQQEENMAATASAGVVTGKPLIESDRVEGTAVYDRKGSKSGSVKRLMIDKKTGQVAYTVLSFGGFLGLGSEEYTLPWNKLDYDTSLGGFRTDITEDQVRGAPNFYRDRDYDWSDRQRERELHDYWKAPYYWGI